jgi:uncharacterized protein YdeI (BOF family)
MAEDGRKIMKKVLSSAGIQQNGRARGKSLGWVIGWAILSLLCGCHGEKGTVLGKAPTGVAHNIIAVRAGDTPPQVTVQGVMVEKCPTAGCWFYLQDKTGTIKVDTKAAGFVVVNVPLQASVTVAGKVSSEGDQVILEGTGLRY